MWCVYVYIYQCDLHVCVWCTSIIMYICMHMCKCICTITHTADYILHYVQDYKGFSVHPENFAPSASMKRPCVWLWAVRGVCSSGRRWIPESFPTAIILIFIDVYWCTSQTPSDSCISFRLALVCPLSWSVPLFPQSCPLNPKCRIIWPSKTSWRDAVGRRELQIGSSDPQRNGWCWISVPLKLPGVNRRWACVPSQADVQQ